MTPSASKTVAIYARVSKANKNKETVSVDQQIAELTQLVLDRGWTVSHIYEDRKIGASGAQKTRPGWNELLKALPTIDVVAMWEISRSSRRVEEWAAFRTVSMKNHVQWLTPDGLVEPKRGDIAQGVGAVIAEHETAQSSKRIRRDVRAAAAEGRPHGKERYGYERKYGTGGRLTSVELVPAEAEVIQWLVTRSLSGASLKALAKELNSKHTPTPAMAIGARVGRPTAVGEWSTTGIRQLLTSPTLVGIREHVEEDEFGAVLRVTRFKGNWPAIITPDEHARLMTKFETNPSWGTGGRGALKHWLTGALTCDVCGKGLRAHQGKNAYTYACPAKHLGIPKEATESYVQEQVLAELENRVVVEAGPMVPLRVGALQSVDVKALGERLDEARQAFAMGQIPIESLTAVEALLSPQIEAATRLTPVPESRVFKYGPKDWDRWDAATRNRVVKGMFGPIPVLRVGKGHRYVPTADRVHMPTPVADYVLPEGL